MTKSQLIKTLEPFDDDITIEILNDKNYRQIPRVFYYLSSGEATILLVTTFEPQGKATELKIRG